jgi:heme-degrading monooxygenase HmoA
MTGGSLLNTLSGKEVCLVDKFFVLKNAVEEFTQRMNYNRNFIKNLPGFIEDKIYVQVDEQGDLNIITVAEWESMDYINEAKNTVQSEYKRIGFNMAEFIGKLDIKIERGIYKLSNI